MLPPFALLPADAAARTTSTKHWLSSLAVSAVVRAALNSVVDAVGDGNRRAAAHGLIAVADIAAPQLDAASMAEIRELATELGN